MFKDSDSNSSPFVYSDSDSDAKDSDSDSDSNPEDSDSDSYSDLEDSTTSLLFSMSTAVRYSEFQIVGALSSYRPISLQIG